MRAGRIPQAEHAEGALRYWTGSQCRRIMSGMVNTDRLESIEEKALAAAEKAIDCGAFVEAQQALAVVQRVRGLRAPGDAPPAPAAS